MYLLLSFCHIFISDQTCGEEEYPVIFEIFFLFKTTKKEKEEEKGANQILFTVIVVAVLQDRSFVQNVTRAHKGINVTL